ncbi:Proteasome-associated protein ECM29 homolog [Strongyloides ratti]|uniref:Proteasome-associated protein ECM29 homolog n=1 Tax=Strongyloides ratti TaxID=34506 RepID=A0A090KUI4_STRRB|nr:Proteasome-associated protein ECM29 homolog [Strongyloides ratti]CEF59535.1 Proteasome-associated protein ECM29 homolog [Strongyloides ratti]
MTAQKLDNYFFRLASIEEKDRLEKFVFDNLVEILRFFDTTDTTIIKSASELITHLKKRISYEGDIKLPIVKLFELLKDQKNPYIVNLSLFFLRTTIKSVNDVSEAINIFPYLFNAILSHQSNRKCCDELLFFSIKLFHTIATQVKRTEYPKTVKDFIENDPILKNELLTFFQHCLAFPNESEDTGNRRIHLIEEGEQIYPPSGSTNSMYVKLATFIKNTGVGNLNIKVGIVKTLSYHVFEEKEIFHLLIMGKAYQSDVVSSIADLAFKTLDVKSCIEDKECISKLFLLYLGDMNSKTPVEKRIGGATYEMKVIILTNLLRSSLAAISFPTNVSVAFESLFKENTDIPQKLQFLSIQFLKNIIESAPDAFIPNFGKIFLLKLKKLITECYYSNVVAIAYQCMGIIGKRVPTLVANDIPFIQDTFDALSTAPSDVESAISDCLLSWLEVIKDNSTDVNINLIEAIVGEYLTHKNPICVLTSIKFFKVLLKFPKVNLRWKLIKAFGSDRLEIKHECQRLLAMSLDNTNVIPDIIESIEFFYNKIENFETKTITNQQEHLKKEISPETYLMTINYILGLIVLSETNDPNHSTLFLKNSEPDEKLDSVILPVKMFLEKNQLKLNDKDCFTKLWKIGFHAINRENFKDLRLLTILGMILGFVKVENLDEKYIKNCQTLLRNNALTTNKHSFNNICSYIYTYLLPINEKKKVYQSTLNELKNGNSPSEGHNWILIHLTFSLGKDEYCLTLNYFIKILRSCLVSPSIQLESCFCALSDLLRYYPLVQKKIFIETLKEYEELYAEFVKLLTPISISMKDTITYTSKAAVARCLGYLSTSDMPIKIVDDCFDGLREIGKVAAQPELQFSVGDSLFDWIFGDVAPSRSNIFDCKRKFNEINPNIEETKRRLVKRFFKEVIVLAGGDKNRHMRSSSYIWLVIFSQLITDDNAKNRQNDIKNELKKYLSVIQQTFINGLNENNDLVQDICSKGLSHIFGIADKEQKDKLLSELTESLASGKTSIIKIEDDEPIFENNALGKTPDGSNLTTYKEICSLATDMNQPDLVYKFMALASHNALWNSRKGAAFGVSAILDQLGDNALNALGGLIPKLYRYTYDPDPKVQLSMKSIWISLTSNQQGVIDKYAYNILKEIVPTLTDKEWRMREASCFALGDLLSSHCTPKMYEEFGEILYILLRVQDDIKESVRISAERCLKQYKRAVIKTCTKKGGEKIISKVLPVLIDKGMQSNVKANRGFSLSMVMEMTKEIKDKIIPYLPIVMSCLLDAMSETEPSVINYIATRSNADELEILDNVRASTARTSPMMSALHDCIPMIDENIIIDIYPLLMDRMKNSIGFVTRSAACNVIINLSIRRPICFTKNINMTDKLVNSLAISGLNDRNPTIRNEFGQAISYILKYSSDSQCLKMINNYIINPLKRHGETEDHDESKLKSVGQLLKNINEHSCEELKPHLPNIVPYVFLIICKDYPKEDLEGKTIKEFWLSVWEELVATTDLACKAYFKDILTVALETLKNSSVWSVKACAAEMLAKVVDVIQDKLDISAAGELFETITLLFAGRIWDGKIKMFKPLIGIIQNKGEDLKRYWNEEKITQQFELIWKECNKKNKLYKAKAIELCGIYVEKLDREDYAEKLVNYFNELFTSQNKETSDDETVEDKRKKYDEDIQFTTQLFVGLSHGLCVVSGDILLKGMLIFTNTLQSSTIYVKIKQSALNNLCYFLLHRNVRYSGALDVTKLFITISKLSDEDNGGNITESFSSDLRRSMCALFDGNMLYIDKNNDNVKLWKDNMLMNKKMTKEFTGQKVERTLKNIDNWTSVPNNAMVLI